VQISAKLRKGIGSVVGYNLHPIKWTEGVAYIAMSLDFKNSHNVSP